MTKGNVISFTGATKIDCTVDQVLDNIPRDDLQSVFVMGFDKDGDPFFASSNADGGEVM